MSTRCTLTLSRTEYANLRAVCPFFVTRDHFLQRSPPGEQFIKVTIQCPLATSKLTIEKVLRACMHGLEYDLEILQSLKLDHVIQILDYIGADRVYTKLFYSTLTDWPNIERMCQFIRAYIPHVGRPHMDKRYPQHSTADYKCGSVCKGARRTQFSRVPL